MNTTPIECITYGNHMQVFSTQLRPYRKPRHHCCSPCSDHPIHKFILTGPFVKTVCQIDTIEASRISAVNVLFSKRVFESKNAIYDGVHH